MYIRVKDIQWMKWSSLKLPTKFILFLLTTSQILREEIEESGIKVNIVAKEEHVPEVERQYES
jgi:hypothetical protein